MGILHGLSINQGKLDVKLSDDNFYIEKDNTIKLNPIVFEEPLKAVPLGTSLERDAVTGQIMLAISQDMRRNGPLGFDDSQKLTFKYGDGLTTDPNSRALKIDSEALATYVSEAIAALLVDADENYDTLQEIADYIKSDATKAAQISNDINALKTNKQNTIKPGSGVNLDGDGNLAVVYDGDTIGVKGGVNELYVRTENLIGNTLTTDSETGLIDVKLGNGLIKRPSMGGIWLQAGDNITIDENGISLALSSHMTMYKDSDGLDLGIGINRSDYFYTNDEGKFDLSLNKVSTDLRGKGLKATNGKLSVNSCDVAYSLSGSGLHIESAKLAINLTPNSYLKVSEDGLSISTGSLYKALAGRGLYYDINGLYVCLDDGHYVDDSYKGGNPLRFGSDDKSLSLEIGSGLKVRCDALELKVADISGFGLHACSDILTVASKDLIAEGLEVNGDNQIKVLLGSGHTTLSGYKEGSPLYYNSDKRNAICLKIDGGLEVKNNTLIINPSNLAGPGLRASNGKLQANYCDIANNIAGIGLSSEGPILNIKIGSGLELNDDNKIRLSAGDVLLTNGATDKRTDNSTSAILDLESKSAIRFKLATGLAIDEFGYLYVDTEKLAQIINPTQTTNEA